MNNNGYDFVDLGLSVNWGTCNIGASKPEEFGYYFQWGDVEAYKSDMTSVNGGLEHDFSTPKGYKFADYQIFYDEYGDEIYSIDMKKYARSGKYADNKLILDPEDDAAHVHWGGGWRIPSEDDANELITLCDYKYVEDYQNTGVNGFIITNRNDSSKFIFLPEAGHLSSRFYNGFHYLINKLSGTSTIDVYVKGITDNAGRNLSVYLYMDRFNGYPIRPVIDKK